MYFADLPAPTFQFIINIRGLHSILDSSFCKVVVIVNNSSVKANLESLIIITFGFRQRFIVLKEKSGSSCSKLSEILLFFLNELNG